MGEVIALRGCEMCPRLHARAVARMETRITVLDADAVQSAFPDGGPPSGMVNTVYVCVDCLKLMGNVSERIGIGGESDGIVPFMEGLLLSEPAAGSLQEDVRETRARLARAQQIGDQFDIALCVVELRELADRADTDAAAGKFLSRASTALRELADETERSS